jgi:hypothetical protein
MSDTDGNMELPQSLDHLHIETESSYLDIYTF